MGATLRYAKVVDREFLQVHGGEIRPSTENRVEVPEDGPTRAAPFLVLRAWDHVDSAFTETWRIVDPHGRTIHEDVTREVLRQDKEIADEVSELEVEYADEGYQLVLEVDGREVARAEFPVVVAPAGTV